MRGTYRGGVRAGPSQRKTWYVCVVLCSLFGAGIATIIIGNALTPPSGPIVTAHAEVCWKGAGRNSSGGCNGTYSDAQGNERPVFIDGGGSAEEGKDVQVRIIGRGSERDHGTTDLGWHPLPGVIAGIVVLPVLIGGPLAICWRILRANDRRRRYAAWQLSAAYQARRWAPGPRRSQPPHHGWQPPPRNWRRPPQR